MPRPGTLMDTKTRHYRDDPVITLEDATRAMEKSLIDASRIVEDREGRETEGNGHHHRQAIGRFGEMVMVTSWANREEAEAHCRRRWGVPLDRVRDLVDGVFNIRP